MARQQRAASSSSSGREEPSTRGRCAASVHSTYHRSEQVTPPPTHKKYQVVGKYVAQASEAQRASLYKLSIDKSQDEPVMTAEQQRKQRDRAEELAATQYTVEPADTWLSRAPLLQIRQRKSQTLKTGDLTEAIDHGGWAMTPRERIAWEKLSPVQDKHKGVLVEDMCGIRYKDGEACKRHSAFTHWMDERERQFASLTNTPLDKATQSRSSRIPVAVEGGMVTFGHTSTREVHVVDVLDQDSYNRLGTELEKRYKAIPLEAVYNGLRGPPANAKQTPMAALEGWYTKTNPDPTAEQASHAPESGAHYALLSLPHYQFNLNLSDKDWHNPEPTGAVIYEIECPAQGLIVCKLLCVKKHTQLVP